ncbi:hypothetical protein LCL97_23425 [Seohaeicola saemankumensis]|nr:hypothetical protein [Seohaeicola saemankumensis]MCA0873793.1 hypothetical protein [Seohaeicola saemankumensis]
MKQDAARQLRHAAKAGEFDWENRFDLLSNMLDYPALFDRKETDSAALDIRLSELRKHLAEGEPVLVRHLADEFLIRNRISLDENDPLYRQLCLKLLRAEIEQLERVRERNSGDYSGAPKDPLLREEGPRKFNATTFAGIIEEQRRLSDKGIGRRKADLLPSESALIS